MYTGFAGEANAVVQLLTVWACAVGSTSSDVPFQHTRSAAFTLFWSVV
jgi:hypothetical protein